MHMTAYQKKKHACVIFAMHSDNVISKPTGKLTDLLTHVQLILRSSTSVNKVT